MIVTDATFVFSTVPTVFGNQETQYLDVIKQMLASSLTDQSSFDVRFAAVKAAINYLLLHEKESTLQKNYGDLLLPILTVSNANLSDHLMALFTSLHTD